MAPKLSCTRVREELLERATEMPLFLDDELLYHQDQSDPIEQAAEMLDDGLILARYILTSRGSQQMIEMYQAGDFGHYQQEYSNQQPSRLIGLAELPGKAIMKAYCPRCMNVYRSKVIPHHGTDKAYFGMGFPHILFMVHAAS